MISLPGTGKTPINFASWYWPSVFWLGGFCLISFYAALCRYPASAALLYDPDGGYQLAGAMMITHGLQPFVDFFDVYGPLVYYTSALSQWIFQERVIGELLLCVIGYTLAHVVFFLLARKLLKSNAAAGLIGILALMLIPRHYKYYILLFPLASLATLFYYQNNPTVKRLWLLSAVVALTGLFRPDFGGYCALTSIMAIALCPPSGSNRIRGVGTFVLATVACALPWLAWISLNGGLGDYFFYSTVEAMRTADKLDLPLPSFGGSPFSPTVANLQALSFRLCLAAPTVMAFYLWRRWSDLSPATKRHLPALIIFAQLTLFQSLHRSDWGHLIQCIAGVLLCAAWLLVDVGRCYHQKKGSAMTGLHFSAGGAGCFAALLIVCTFFATWQDARARITSPRTLWATVKLYCQPKPEIIQQVLATDPNHEAARILSLIRSCSTGGTLIVLPANPQFSYFSDMDLTCGMLAVLPGYFDALTDQQKMIAEIKAGNTGLAVVQEGNRIDGAEERMLENYARPLIDAIRDHGHLIAQIGVFKVFSLRENSTDKSPIPY